FVCDVSTEVCHYHTGANYRCLCRAYPVYVLFSIYLLVFYIYLRAFGTRYFASRRCFTSNGCFRFCRWNGCPYVCGSNGVGICYLPEARQNSERTYACSYYICIIRYRLIVVWLVWF